MHQQNLRLLPFLLCVLAAPLQAAEVSTLKQAITGGDVHLNFRYRYEYVDQDGINDEAQASTLRSRLTFNSAPLHGWALGVEADYTAVIGDERYNSTTNGETQFPVVADPEGFDLNQAFFGYSTEELKATVGRQRIVHAEQRFVGGVAWRQNEQTYDAARVAYDIDKHISLDYSYVWNVNRIFGPDDGAQPSDWRSNSHMLLAKWRVDDNHRLDAYAYLLDFENDNGLPNSTATYGIAYQGSFGPAKVDLEYATQSDHADSPLDYSADFWRAAVAADLGALTLTVGYEELGSDNGTAAFRTPLATLHKFQGWADKFLLTPADGIQDVHVGVSSGIGKLKLALHYHDFSADNGSANYGDEINLVATYPISDLAQVQLKYADYNADDFATDTTKFWMTFIVKL